MFVYDDYLSVDLPRIHNNLRKHIIKTRSICKSNSVFSLSVIICIISLSLSRFDLVVQLTYLIGDVNPITWATNYVNPFLERLAKEVSN